MSKKKPNTLLPAVLFGSFMLLQYVILRLGNQAGRGYLSDDAQELVYYALQVFAILGFLSHAILQAVLKSARRMRAVLFGAFGLLLPGFLLLLLLPTDSAFYLTVTMLTVLCLGLTGGAVYLRMSAFMQSGVRCGLCLSVGCGFAIALQYVLQLRWTLQIPLCAAAVLAFALLVYGLLCREAPEAAFAGQTAAPGKKALFAAAIALAMLLFTTYYTGYIHHLQVSSAYQSYNVYAWPRLFMIPGLLLFGVLGDHRQGRLLPVGALCAVFLALMNSVLSGSSEAYWLNMSLYYIALSGCIAYYHLVFWRLSAKTKRPALWAPMGRMLDSAAVLLSWTFGLSQLSTAAILTVDVLLLAVTIVLMAVNGDFNLSAPETAAASEKTAVSAPQEPTEDPFGAIQNRFGLTQGELKVYRELVLTEDKQQAIADRLDVKLRTVQANVTAIYRKTGATTRAGLVLLYRDAEANGK